MTTDPLALEAQVCFALSAASRGLVALYRPLLDPLGLTHPQYLVMLALWDGDAADAPATVTHLADRLHLDAGTLSPLLKRLESHGLVRRERAVADARVVTVALTAEGRALRERARDVPPAIVAATGLSLDELEHVHRAASLVVDAARRGGALAG
ncbi:MarR family transcriptional regulator [Sediminihabitans luteus]|uniref:MarR family transcriptional regulator n=1 Tax=Sediminihabitans luteus TaxID=1138585 RepID=A0A2M9CZZ8_9CELL|nr:MarR family transcriptional regulator [Sediminihabitans luteus]PJJ77514.1 MarR family transcriptional regulator [Sediminihabitans luteus]GII98413.1 MarR family transcriptional regulator [Sediminihabitans luteus]